MVFALSCGMDWPKTPVERLQAFRPPFCPRDDCADHRRDDGRFRFRVHGSFPTRSNPHNKRYLCLRCNRTFCRNSFSTRYYLKRPELLVPVAAGLVAGSAHRQIARSVGCSPSTVTRMSARIGRPNSRRASASTTSKPSSSRRTSRSASPRRSAAIRGSSTALIPHRTAGPDVARPHRPGACAEDLDGRGEVATPARPRGAWTTCFHSPHPTNPCRSSATTNRSTARPWTVTR
jgi:transposase-like protein